MHKERCLLTTIQSDSHTWNLVYMQLLLESYDYEVNNLGACVPVQTVEEAISKERLSLVVVSSVNGSGATQGRTLIRKLRQLPCAGRLRIVIGGNLTVGEGDDLCVREDLLAAGYDGVFVGPHSTQSFSQYIARNRIETCHSQVTSAYQQRHDFTITQSADQALSPPNL